MPQVSEDPRTRSKATLSHHGLGLPEDRSGSPKEKAWAGAEARVGKDLEDLVGKNVHRNCRWKQHLGISFRTHLISHPQDGRLL